MCHEFYSSFITLTLTLLIYKSICTKTSTHIKNKIFVFLVHNTQLYLKISCTMQCIQTNTKYIHSVKTCVYFYTANEKTRRSTVHLYLSVTLTRYVLVCLYSNVTIRFNDGTAIPNTRSH